MARPQLKTELCELLGIQHPILLAGMAGTSSGRLAAAVSNAGGMGVIGGFGYTPKQLREHIKDLKAELRDPSLPFGIDLAIPQVGGNARKTNYDYTHGTLDELIEITIEAGAKMFVCAIGVPPERVIKRLHDAGILIMNMIGHPKHAYKAFRAGVDVVCAQGTEGGGHTGEIATSVLVPAAVDAAKQFTSPLTGKPCLVVGAGGISSGRSIAAMLAYGAVGVWVGTRFVACVEAGTSQMHKEAVVTATFEDTMRTLVLSGRPVRVRPNDYVLSWEVGKPDEIKRLVDSGVIPMDKDLADDKDVDRPFLMGQVAGAIKSIQTAQQIVDEMVAEAVDVLTKQPSYVVGASSKL